MEQSERLGISRTPLREALSRLTAEGLTTTAGGRGVVVTDISLDDIDELFELRETLEGRAAALAAERGDPAIFDAAAARTAPGPGTDRRQDPARHDYYELVGRLDAAIDAAISNSYLAQAMRSLRVHLVRVRRLAADDAARLTAAAAEHAAIAEAIAAGNPRLAEAATTVHLHRSLSHVKATHTPQLKGAPWLRNTTSASTRARKTWPARTSWPTRSPRSPPTPWRSPTRSPTW